MTTEDMDAIDYLLDELEAVAEEIGADTTTNVLLLWVLKKYADDPENTGVFRLTDHEGTVDLASVYVERGRDFHRMQGSD